MERIIQGLKNSTFQLWLILFVFLIMGITAYLILKHDPAQFGIPPDSVLQTVLLFSTLILTGGLLLFILLLFITTYFFGKKAYRRGKAQTTNRPFLTQKNKKGDSPVFVTVRKLKNYLRTRYNLFWRHKVRLLLITGDEAAIEQLVPG
ncbi:hypothetical protein MND13_00005, partial [Pantoea allii]|nr:hypothetical protein [Pantoea allii]